MWLFLWRRRDVAEVLSCSTQRMATRGKHREEATARNRGSHEPGTRANRRPGFHGIGALGRRLCRGQPRHAAGTNNSETLRGVNTKVPLARVPVQARVTSRGRPARPSSQRETSCLPGKGSCRLQNGEWAFTGPA